MVTARTMTAWSVLGRALGGERDGGHQASPPSTWATPVGRRRTPTGLISISGPSTMIKGFGLCHVRPTHSHQQEQPNRDQLDLIYGHDFGRRPHMPLTSASARPALQRDPTSDVYSWHVRGVVFYNVLHA
jgi:hypothetical protein